MTSYIRTAVLMTSTALAASVLLAAPVAAAPDYVLDAAGIEQTVLRAQMPKTLGGWRQNIYFSQTKAAPYVCWSAKGTPVQLPKAASMGGVGYEVSQTITSGVSIYQYKDAAAAATALTALKSVDCPDDAKIGEDGPATAVAADQGSDYTDASQTGFVSSISSTQQGTPATTITRTTQRGLAVVQTTVSVSGPADTKKGRVKAEALNTRWHEQVLAAYEAFGSGNSR